MQCKVVLLLLVGFHIKQPVKSPGYKNQVYDQHKPT